MIRQRPKGAGAAVTWAEVVEAGLLRQYRRELKVPLPQLRVFIDLLREGFDLPYPLADQRPYASGKALVLEAQQAAGLPGEFWLVTVAGSQLLLTPASESFLRRARWEGEIATGWRPHDDQDSTVLIDPTIRFGRPADRRLTAGSPTTSLLRSLRRARGEAVRAGRGRCTGVTDSAALKATASSMRLCREE